MAAGVNGRCSFDEFRATWVTVFHDDALVVSNLLVMNFMRNGSPMVFLLNFVCLFDFIGNRLGIDPKWGVVDHKLGEIAVIKHNVHTLMQSLHIFHIFPAELLRDLKP